MRIRNDHRRQPFRGRRYIRSRLKDTPAKTPSSSHDATLIRLQQASYPTYTPRMSSNWSFYASIDLWASIAKLFLVTHGKRRKEMHLSSMLNARENAAGTSPLIFFAYPSVIHSGERYLDHYKKSHMNKQTVIMICIYLCATRNIQDSNGTHWCTELDLTHPSLAKV